jgi:hypothetical protein
MVISNGGNVSFGPKSAFVCPKGSSFLDVFDNLCKPTDINLFPPSVCSYSATRCQLGCSICPNGTYTLETSGFLNGSVENKVTCITTCPLGGNCVNGSITAKPGFWGFSTLKSTVAFVRCPDGYCCSTLTASAGGSSLCSSFSSCADGRTDTLCGRCLAGLSEAIGSPACLSEADCRRLAPVAIPLLIVAVLIAALIQLCAVSDVWCASRVHSKGSVRVLLYFFQVCLLQEAEVRLLIDFRSSCFR